VVELLLDKDADVNVQDERIELLVHNGGNIEERRWGTALQAASFKGNEKLVKLLLDKGADVNAEGGYFGTALQAASCRSHENLVELLLGKGALSYGTG
jgi:hypothetical protein